MYSIHIVKNYVRKVDGSWHRKDMAVWDEKGYTRKFQTIEDAETYLTERFGRITNPDEEGYIVKAKIQQGRQIIKTIERA